MWYKNDFFKFATGTLLVLAIIFLFLQIKDVFNLLFLFIGAVFPPVIVAGALYYIVRPIRNYLEEKKIPRIMAIIIIYALLCSFLSILITFIWPSISEEIKGFLATPEQKYKEIELNTLNILNSFGFPAISQEQLRQTLLIFSTDLFNWVSSNIVSTLNSIVKVTTFIIISPLLLFYLLKEDYKFSLALQSLIPVKFTKFGLQIIEDIDQTLSTFISSQFIIACIVGILIFIGYLLIDLNYAFLLAAIALVFNLIPFAGPFISTIPAIIVGLSTSSFMVIKVIAVVLGVHFLDMYFISPKIIGSKLNIHPITVILLLIASIPLFGIWGVFLITPVYAALKMLMRDLKEFKVESEAKSG